MKKKQIFILGFTIAGVMALAVLFYFVKNSGDGKAISADFKKAEDYQTMNGAADSGKLKYPLEIKEVNLEYLLSQKKPVIIDFGADDCVPCRDMAPVLEKLNAEMQDTAIIQFVDVWKNQKAIGNFPIQVIPAQVFYTADRKPYIPSASVSIPFDYYGFDDSDDIVFTVHQGGLTEDQMRLIIEDMLKQGGV
ncbi:MAG TPA: thioredoxin family protein [Treponemataceae bacterium]|nr:thioredoxin family protein [Treponemataceae bacterium]